ncbi:MAG: LytTR family transcriptional regulator [Firmicutes bacterium]|nr:LytTR family transcriptional regulator [Bacillota bacterium]
MLEHLRITYRGQIALIPQEEIIYMLKDRRKICIKTTNNEYEFYGQFKDIMPLLGEHFIQPHRSYVLNIKCIREMKDMQIFLINAEAIILGRACFYRCRKYVEEYYG